MVDPQVLERISDFDFVLFIELIQGNKATHNQSMPLIGADYIRTGGSGTRYDGSSVTLGICDTGFMLGGAAPAMHWDLNKNGCGINFTTDAADVWDDEHGHGTHVLTTISGTGTGQLRYRGFATGLGSTGAPRIRAAKIWNSTGGSPDSTWMVNGMNYMDNETGCSSPRPDLVNISGGGYWGSPLAGTDELSRTLDDKVWTYKQLYVIAAGNDGSGVSTVGAPAVAKNALAVGNVRDYDYMTVGDIWTSSSRGPTADGRMKPNLVAPGRLVTSAEAGTANGYTTMSGTSMATPHVSGLAATLMDHYSAFISNPALIRAYLMASSILHDDDTTPTSNSSGGRNDYGLGRVSTYVSHWAKNNSDGWTGHWTWGNVDDETYVYRDITVPEDTARLVVVMTWDEPAASSGASDAVLYDLDLYIDHGADCSGTLGRCGEYSSLSFVDNVEYRIIENPPAGTYRLKATPWDAPSSGLPVAIAAVVIRGDPTPDFTISTTSSTSSPCTGQDFTITTNITPDSYILSGAHLALTSLPSGVTLQNVSTVREDNINMDFGAATQFTLGNIRVDDTRSVVWTFRAGTPGSKSFTFRVWSENGGTETKSTSVTAGCAPDPPGSISYATYDCDGTFTISWATVSSANSYTLQRATNSSFTDATLVYMGSSLFTSQIGLSHGTYYYRVRANNSCGSSSWKNGESIIIMSTPAVPDTITYHATDCDGNFAVSWAASPEAMGYTLQRATQATFNDATIVYSGASTSFNQTGLAQGSYYYRVRASNYCGNSGWRNGGLTQVISVPSAPATITYASTDCDGTFTVSWASVTGAEQYALQRASNSGFTDAVTPYTGSGTSYNQTGLAPGTYYYRVMVSNYCGNSPYKVGGAITVSSTPGTPSSITYPTEDADGNFTIQWASSGSGVTYLLQRAANSSFTGAVTAYSGSSLSYPQTGLADGTYYYRVRASNGCGNSGWRTGYAISVGDVEPLAYDFNKDNRADLLYRHPGNGNIGTWLMKDLVEDTWQLVGNHGTAWDIKAVGDMNQDTFMDIVYRHTSGNIGVWLMNGTTETTWQLIGNHGTGWDVKGAGDFDKDGKSDLLYRHTNGKIGVWLMDGISEDTWHLIGNHGTSWDVYGVADFNRDGHADILYRHNDGRIGVWLMNGTTESTWHLISNHGSAWTPKCLSDYNDDNDIDIIYRHDSGNVGVWLMDGLTENTWHLIGNHGTWDVR